MSHDRFAKIADTRVASQHRRAAIRSIPRRSCHAASLPQGAAIDWPSTICGRQFVRRASWFAFVISLLLAALAAPGRVDAQSSDDPDTLNKQAQEFYGRGKYADALDRQR